MADDGGLQTEIERLAPYRLARHGPRYLCRYATMQNGGDGEVMSFANDVSDIEVVSPFRAGESGAAASQNGGDTVMSFANDRSVDRRRKCESGPWAYAWNQVCACAWPRP